MSNVPLKPSAEEENFFFFFLISSTLSPLEAFEAEEVSGCALLLLFPGGCGVSSLHASGFTLGPRKAVYLSVLAVTRRRPNTAQFLVWFANPDAVLLRSTGRCESSEPSQERGALRVSGGPGTGPRGWTGRPRSEPGCGSGYCRWRETEDRDTKQSSVRKSLIYTAAESHGVSSVWFS